MALLGWTGIAVGGIVIVLLAIIVLALFAPVPLPHDQSVPSKTKRKQTLHASIVPACTQCKAPGLYSNEDRIKQYWSGCFDPSRAGQPVGETCPHCLSLRPATVNKGEIWRREIDA